MFRNKVESGASVEVGLEQSVTVTVTGHEGPNDGSGGESRGQGILEQTSGMALPRLRTENERCIRKPAHRPCSLPVLLLHSLVSIEMVAFLFPLNLYF
jgi:hypothetical protein